MKSVQSEGWGRVSPGPGSGSGSGSGCGQVFSSLTLISTGYWQRPWYSCCCCCGLKYKMGTSFSVGSGSGPVPSLNHLGLGFVGPYRAPNTNSNILFRRVCQEFRPYKNSCSSINASPKPRIFGNAGWCLESSFHAPQTKPCGLSHNFCSAYTWDEVAPWIAGKKNRTETIGDSEVLGQDHRAKSYGFGTRF